MTSAILIEALIVLRSGSSGAMLRPLSCISNEIYVVLLLAYRIKWHATEMKLGVHRTLSFSGPIYDKSWQYSLSPCSSRKAPGVRMSIWMLPPPLFGCTPTERTASLGVYWSDTPPEAVHDQKLRRAALLGERAAAQLEHCQAVQICDERG